MWWIFMLVKLDIFMILLDPFLYPHLSCPSLRWWALPSSPPSLWSHSSLSPLSTGCSWRVGYLCRCVKLPRCCVVCSYTYVLKFNSVCCPIAFSIFLSLLLGVINIFSLNVSSLNSFLTLVVDIMGVMVPCLFKFFISSPDQFSVCILMRFH